MSYSQHPLSSAFPSMDTASFRALVEDIRSHGQRDPATLCDGMIIDGWHRYRACQELGISCRLEEFSGLDAVAFVRSKNQHRRHYQKSQQAAIEVSLTDWAVSHRPNKGEAASPLATNKEMAERAGTTERTIQHAKRAHEAGLGEAVRDGKISAERAAEIAKADPDLAKQVGLGEKTLPQAVEEITGKRPGSKPKNPANPIKTEPELVVNEIAMRLESANDAIDSLVEENERFKNQLAAMVFDGSEEEKEELLGRLDAMSKELKTANAMVAAITRSRDQLMLENASLKRHVAMLQKQINKAA